MVYTPYKIYLGVVHKLNAAVDAYLGLSI